MSVSGAVTVAGAVMLGLALSDRSSVEGAADGAAWSDVSGAYDRATPLSAVGLAAIGVGLAGAAIGVVLLLGQGSDGTETAVALSPTGLAIRGSF